MNKKESSVRRDVNLALDKEVFGPKVTSWGKEASRAAEY